MDRPRSLAADRHSWVRYLDRDQYQEGAIVNSARWVLPVVASALAALCLPATPASASEPDPADITYTATYTPLDEAGSLDADAVDAPPSTSLSAASRPPGNDFPYDDVTHGECVTHGNSNGKAEWIKNHLALCRRG
jgi:hypothetical protein